MLHFANLRTTNLLIFFFYPNTQARMKYDAQELIPAAKSMLLKLQQYFDQALLKPVYLCATLLDPHIKTTLLTQHVLDLMNKTKPGIISIFKDMAEMFTNDSQYTEKENNNEDASSKKPIKDGLFKRKRIKVSSLQEEIQAYLDAECEEESTDPVKFWKLKSQQLPTLACMARTYLSVPASSAPCERVFSAGRYIQNYTRNRLNLETLESLICLKDWVQHSVVDINSISEAD